MKIRHNPNGGWHRPSAVVDPDYEAEVQRCTQRAEKAHERARRRLERAEARLASAKAHKTAKNKKRQIAELTAIVELRREELEQLRRTMQNVPASAQHRGTKSYRPVPAPKEF